MTRLTEEQKSQMKNSFQAIGNSSKEIVQFVENMMIYRDDKREFRSVNLPVVMNALTRFCRSQVAFQTIKFDLEVPADFPTSVPLKEDQFRRVMINLLVNAAEALAQSENAEYKRIVVRLDVSPESDQAVIKVTDNGPGIDEKLLPKLFKERFTTKERGHGIGLMSVAKIVQAHGGEINVDSKLGGGTTFEIRLPLRRGDSDG